MGQIPLFLLRHTVTVEPYLGTWGSYGPGVPLRCHVDRKIRTATSSAGVTRTATITILARRGATVPEGSRITLADGTRGYAEAVADHDGGGLPTPDHLEIAMTAAVASFGAPLGGETVILLQRVKTGQDRYHNDLYGVASVAIQGCAVRVVSSDENDTGSRDKTTDNVEVTMPPGTEVQRVDRLRVRGLVYNVDGTPEEVRDPMTGATAGVRVIGQRVTG